MCSSAKRKTGTERPYATLSLKRMKYTILFVPRRTELHFILQLSYQRKRNITKKKNEKIKKEGLCSFRALANMTATVKIVWL